MPLLIDAFNVLHTTGVLPPDLAGLDIEELRGVIALSRYRHQPIKLICDGTPPAAEAPSWQSEQDSFADESAGNQSHGFRNISTQWSGNETDADTIIEILVAQDSAPRRLTVITSDRRLTMEIRKRRVRVMPSEVFLENLSADFRENIERVDSPTATQNAARPAFAYDVPLHRDSVRWWLTYLGIDADDPRIAGQHIPVVAPDAIQAQDELDALEDCRQPVQPESDPIRWWLRYFGLDPEALPTELRVSAAPEMGDQQKDLTPERREQTTQDDRTASDDDDDESTIIIDEIDPEALL